MNHFLFCTGQGNVKHTDFLPQTLLQKLTADHLLIQVSKPPFACPAKSHLLQDHNPDESEVLHSESWKLNCFPIPARITIRKFQSLTFVDRHDFHGTFPCTRKVHLAVIHLVFLQMFNIADKVKQAADSWSSRNPWPFPPAWRGWRSAVHHLAGPWHNCRSRFCGESQESAHGPECTPPDPAFHLEGVIKPCNFSCKASLSLGEIRLYCSSSPRKCSTLSYSIAFRVFFPDYGKLLGGTACQRGTKHTRQGECPAEDCRIPEDNSEP